MVLEKDTLVNEKSCKKSFHREILPYFGSALNFGGIFSNFPHNCAFFFLEEWLQFFWKEKHLLD